MATPYRPLRVGRHGVSPLPGASLVDHGAHRQALRSCSNHLARALNEKLLVASPRPAFQISKPASASSRKCEALVVPRATESSIRALTSRLVNAVPPPRST